MVAILVLLTFVAFILAEWYLVARKRRARDTTFLASSAKVPLGSQGPPTDPVADLYFHPGHSWARVAPDGQVAVGVSDFAANFAGEIATVDMPRPGQRLRQGEPAWTLVSRRSRRLSVPMPVDGRVVEVNDRLRRTPGLVQRAPYGAGWIMRIRPRRLGLSLRNLLHARAATLWRDWSRSGITAQLTPALGMLAHDGGEWVPAFGDRLADADWEAIRRDIFPPGDPSTPTG